MSAPKLPRLEMVKVPDWNSSGDSCLARARFTRSAQFRLICANTTLVIQLHVATYPVLALFHSVSCALGVTAGPPCPQRAVLGIKTATSVCRLK